jgi:neutral ceramidase
VRNEVSRRLRLALGLALALAVPPAAASAAQGCADCLEAGAARVPLRIPAGAPLAGYGSLARRLLIPDVLGRHPHAFWFRPAEGARDQLAARALVLESAGTRVAWVAIDLLAVDRAFTTDAGRRLAAAGVRPATLVISASHTHSGPGAFVDSAALGWLALDRLDRAVRDALLDSVVAAVRRADAARRPARVAVGSTTAPPVTVSRLHQPLDAEIVVLRVTAADGAPLALVWNYAIHGTMLSAQDLRLSADVMGDASTALERALAVPALFVNGAAGDVSPAHHGDRAAHDIGGELAAAVRRGWTAATAVTRPTVSVAVRGVALPEPRLPVTSCVRGWAPRALDVPLGSVFPRETTLTAVAVGDAAWVTIPGELQTKLGLAIKQGARSRFPHAMVAGYSNDYLGYLLTAADYARPSYVACSSLYGPHAGECLAAAAGGLLAGLGRGERPPGARVACDRDAGGG